MLKNINGVDRNMSFGRRDISGTPLSDKEIEYIKQEIRTIGADETKFVFNDKRHIDLSTCYNHRRDIIYVTRNIFPDLKSNTNHPRDLMSVRAVLAHEYYGHRTFRDEYLMDDAIGDDYYTTEPWKDEYRASMTAAKITPNLTQEDRAYLVLDAKSRAEEAFQPFEEDDFTKEVLYGYKNDEHNITPNDRRSPCPYRQSMERLKKRFNNFSFVPPVQNSSQNDYGSEWLQM